MSAIDDAWSAAQGVRMWVATANDALSALSNPTTLGIFARLLSRGATNSARTEEAIDAIGKMRLAYLDLEHALHRAGLSPLRLVTFEQPVVKAPYFRVGMTLRRDQANQLAAAVADLAAVDSLIEELERLQRQARAPQLR